MIIRATEDVVIAQGDCRDFLDTLDAESIDSIVTDPPYELGFMGRAWDRSGVAFDPRTWSSCLRVLKPGGHLLAFGGTRTYHRMTVAIEDAGFEIRDSLHWIYGQGKPATTIALKPAHEPIVVARKPFIGTVTANIETHGVGGLFVGSCRVAGSKPDTTRGAGGQHGTYSPIAAQGRILDDGKGRWPPNVILSHAPECVREGSRELSGKGIGSWSKPRSMGYYGGTTDESGAYRCAPEVLDTWLCVEHCPCYVMGAQSGVRAASARCGMRADMGYMGGARGTKGDRVDLDEGTAARFFPQFEVDPFLYNAKASRSERGEGNTHPTVKPIEVMRWLVRLVTPIGGIVLDPFTGSGTTGLAAMREGMSFVGCELKPEHVEIILARLDNEVRKAA